MSHGLCYVDRSKELAICFITAAKLSSSMLFGFRTAQGEFCRSAKPLAFLTFSLGRGHLEMWSRISAFSLKLEEQVAFPSLWGPCSWKYNSGKGRAITFAQTLSLLFAQGQVFCSQKKKKPVTMDILILGELLCEVKFRGEDNNAQVFATGDVGVLILLLTSTHPV